MERKLRELLEAAVSAAVERGQLQIEKLPPFSLELPKEKGHGDLSTNLAMVLAKKLKVPPQLVARTIVENLETGKTGVERVEVAGPGFINFFFSDTFFQETLEEIAAPPRDSEKTTGEKILIEFVSANPTGPLNVVNARAAAVGDTIACLLRACGQQADREFYVNDEGSQIENLARSVEARYRELLGETVPAFPEDWYAGEYVKEIAGKIRDGFGDVSDFESLGRKIYGTKIFADDRHPFLKNGFGDRLFSLVPDERDRIEFLARVAVIWNVRLQQKVLERFGVVFQNWYFQSQLGDRLNKGIVELEKRGHVYEADGALWFRSTAFKDDKDRVLKRQGGAPTYFAADVAYHAYKKERGYERLIDLLGPDHHGYIPRTEAAIQALGYPADSLEIYLIQLVTLMSGGKPLRMSKRAGEFITMEELIDEVGVDAARWYFLQRHRDSHLEFDLDLAKLQSDENPLYYVQYAHARICSILRMAEEQKTAPVKGKTDLSPLTHPTEKELIKKMAQWPTIVEVAAENREPHHLTRYAGELARAFHAFYSECRVLGNADAAVTGARLFLCLACRDMLAQVLFMMGISAPDKM